MMTYGEMIQRLEQIVGTLEKGEASLEESLKLFEEATQLVGACNKTLMDARQKVTQLTEVKESDNG